jgi:tetratricopeptide (TPR) repeat protein
MARVSTKRICEVPNMKSASLFTVFVCVAVAAFCGYAEPKITVKQAFQESKQTAWSIRGEKQEFKVSVSPAGQAIGMIPRVGGAIGTGVDFVVNDRYRVLIHEALGKYDLSGFVNSCLEKRLKEVAPGPLREVSPLGNTAGFSNDRDAEKARLQTLKESGVNLLLDLKVQYGIYDAGFDMKFDIEGKLLDLPKRKRLWMGSVPVVAEPYLADVKFENFILKRIPYIHAPKFAADKDEMKRLTDNDAALLKKEFEKAVEGGISAVLCDMGLIDEAAGHYFLGRKAFQKKHYAKAQDEFVRAVNLDHGLLDARNDLSVTYARLGAPDKAAEFATQILADAPDYAPAMFNLAWWNAFEKRNAAEARRYYTQALEKGVPPSKKLDKELKKLEAGK